MQTTTIDPVTKPQSVLGLGCWAFAGAAWGGQDDAKSEAAIQAAFDAGMNHFDTARAYGNGKSERVLAPFLAKHRDDIFLATKGNTPNAKPEEIRSQLEASLEDLGVDSVDLYYIHWPRSGQDMKPVLQEMEKMRSEGKLKAIGVSNFSVDQMKDIANVAKIDAHQLCYNLLWRPLENEVMPYCRENDIAIVTYSSIAQGILTGKFGKERPDFPEGDQREGNTLFDREAWPHVADGVERMKAVAEKEGQPLVNLAIQWVARQPGVSTVLLGARDADQAKQNATAYETPVSDDAIQALTAISDDVIKHIPDTGNIFQYYP
jgi:aryl-alcohol dehydrogenase-like predicted oxidoreductase